MIDTEELVELTGEINALVMQRLLLKRLPRDMRECRDRCEAIGLILGRVMAAVAHEGPLSPRYMELTAECEVKGLAMLEAAQVTAQKATLKVVK